MIQKFSCLVSIITTLEHDDIAMISRWQAKLEPSQRAQRFWPIILRMMAQIDEVYAFSKKMQGYGKRGANSPVSYLGCKA